jgi:HTH-type transcriptional regulator / antitoxin HipB
MHIATALELGSAIRTERLRRGFSQESLAAAAGVGARFVVELERGKASAQLDKALAVASAVGLTVSVAAMEPDDA